MAVSCAIILKVNRGRGVTLVELMVGVAILAMIGTGLLMSTTAGRSRASSRALADRMAEVFKQARETAIAQQRPVAVLLPCTSTSPLADSYEVADGLDRAVVRRSQSFRQELAGSFLFVGHWSLSLGTNSAPQPLAGANQGGLNLSTWTLPEPSHAAYVYSPSGTLISNRVEFDQAYHIVVCQGAEWSTESVDGVSSARLTAANSPLTLRLSKAGPVSVVPQVEDHVGVAVDAAPAGGSALPGSGAPPVTANLPPSIKNVTVDPKPQPGTLPVGVDATVALDGYLTLQVEATDPEGDPLEVLWIAEPVDPTAGPGGSLSSPVRTRMSFESGVQRSTWEWRPPAGSVAGNLYSLTLQVRDDHGNEVTDDAFALDQVLTVDPGTILFVDDRGGNRDLYTMNNDGTNEMQLTRTPADEAWPQLSPDGSRIMYVKDIGGTQVLMTVGIDGENPKQVLAPDDLPPHLPTLAPVDSIVGCCWSPDGTRIAVIARYGGAAGGLDVYVCNADGSGRFKAHSDEPEGGLSVTGAVKITWDFDPPYDRGDLTGQRLIFTSPYDSRYFAFFLDPPRRDSEVHFDGRVVTDINAGPDGRIAWVEGGQLRIGDFTEAGGLNSGTVIAGSVSGVAGPAWSPSADRLVFSGQSGASTRLYRVDANGSGLVPLTGAGTALEASWGP
jgi:type II secretory pathway pseudopilin PulG